MDIESIMDMLDWHADLKIQSKGREMAENLDVIVPFILPATPKYNKNVWENCAIIIAKKTDDELKLHLISLMEWLQDMTWPGAFNIFERLTHFRDDCLLKTAINMSIQQARSCNDEIWVSNLSNLIKSM